MTDIRQWMTLVETADLETVQAAVLQLRKDPATGPIFKKSTTNYDHPAIAKTFNRLITSNPAVRRFIEENDLYHFKISLNGRYDIENDPGKYVIDSIRELAKVVSARARGSLTASTKKQLLMWVNSDGVPARLYDSTIRELAATPSVRPDTPQVLYRGLLFKRWRFQDAHSSDPRSIFAKMIRAKVEEGDLTFGTELATPTSWSSSIDTAERFARFSSASSQYGAMMSWLHRGKRAIDGELGVIIKATVQPQDILVDLNRVQFSGHMIHGNESEMILKPGANIQVEIVQAWTQDGEIDLKKSLTESAKVRSVEVHFRQPPILVYTNPNADQIKNMFLKSNRGALRAHLGHNLIVWDGSETTHDHIDDSAEFGKLRYVRLVITNDNVIYVMSYGREKDKPDHPDTGEDFESHGELLNFVRNNTLIQRAFPHYRVT